MTDSIEKAPPIPDNPPSSAKATEGAVAGIAAIKKACIDNEITSKYAICAVLGIIGVESKWMYNAEESSAYKVHSLLNRKKPATPADAQKYGYDAGGKGMSKQEFFGWFYGTKRGDSPAEGQYYGRGFFQLSLSSTYTDIGKKLGVDLLKNPEMVISSPEFSAKVAIAIVKLKVPSWRNEQWKSSFFETLKNGIGGIPGGFALKQSYYEYFLGGKSDSAPTNKDATKTSSSKTPAEIDNATPTKKEAFTEDRSANFSTVGFTDPEGKYPLRDYMNEPDTNRLARGVSDGTCVAFKDATRRTSIPIANHAGADTSGGIWDEPLSSYNTVYPLNKVFESESGHVLEFDDSPDGERVNLYHSKGTFIEITPDGSQINHIMGDSFHITESNGNVLINGTCNITVMSELNILCQGDANIEVNGEVDLVVHDNLNIGVAGDFNLAIGGEYNLLVEGNCNTQVAKTMNSRAVGSMSMESSDALKLKTAKNISMEGGDTASTAETLMKMSSDIKIETSGSYAIKAKSFTLDIEGAIETTSNSILINSQSTTQIATDSFQLESIKDTNILTGSFNATAIAGNLELTSSATSPASVITAQEAVTGTMYTIESTGSLLTPTDFTKLGASANTKGVIFIATQQKTPITGNGTLLLSANISVSAQEVTTGYSYLIENVGTTDFTKLGALLNIIGTTFKAIQPIDPKTGDVLPVQGTGRCLLVRSATGTVVINAPTTVNMNSRKIDLNGETPMPSTAIPLIPKIVLPLDPLGAPAQVVDFSGNILPNRPEEHVLVDTALSPTGISNPNSLPEKAVSSILSGSTPSLNDLMGSSGIEGLADSALGLALGPVIGGEIGALVSGLIGAAKGAVSSLYSAAPASAIPDIYSTKFSGPMESKTSLSSAGGPTNPYSKLQVPTAIGSSQSPHPNLVPSSRHSDPQSQFETPDDWATAGGMSAANAMTSTSDYENNVAGKVGSASSSSAATGGTGNGKQLSADKLADINSKSNFPANYPLSAHFTLGMFVQSQGHTLQDTVLAKGKSESSGPASKAYSKQQLVANLAALCENIMEPIFTLLGPCKQMGAGATWNITSGLRNEKTGSDHNKGRACDFQLSPRASISEMYKLVVQLEKMLPYNQLIFEYRKKGASNWIHVSYSTEGNQGKAFTMCDDAVVNSSGKPAPGSSGLFEFYT